MPLEVVVYFTFGKMEAPWESCFECYPLLMQVNRKPLLLV